MLSRPLALGAAALAISVPSMVYTATLMTENAFYPLFLWLALALVLAGVALARRPSLPRLAVPTLAVALAAAAEAILWRLFPAGGRHPFSCGEAAAAVADLGRRRRAREAAHAPRSTWPGRAPVWRPSSSSTTPFTTTAA